MFTLARRLIRPAAETDAKIDAKWPYVTQYSDSDSIDWRGPRHLRLAGEVRKWEEWRTLSSTSGRGQMHELSLFRRYDASLEWGSHGSSVLREASV
jgi:hypothetical protein